MFRKAPLTRGDKTLWVTCTPLTLSMSLRKAQPYLKSENRGSKEVLKLQYEFDKKQSQNKFSFSSVSTLYKRLNYFSFFLSSKIVKS
jgi:hypothetical protein